MGLGKTVQTVSLVRMAKERYGVKFPALIVAPLSTIAHWQREFQHWTNLDVMVYHGSARGREAARRTDVQVRNDRKGIAVDVVITTYEQLLLDDTAPLGRSKWGVVVVDEAHRLKNPQSRLYARAEPEINVPTAVLAFSSRPFAQDGIPTPQPYHRASSL